VILFSFSRSVVAEEFNTEGTKRNLTENTERRRAALYAFPPCSRSWRFQAISWMSGSGNSVWTLC